MRNARRLPRAGQLRLEGAAAARAVAVTLAIIYVLSTIPTPLY